MGTIEDHRHDRVPPALWIGLALLGAGSALQWLFAAYLWDAEPADGVRMRARLDLAREGLRIAVPILLLAGVADLRRRLAPATTHLLTAGLVALLVVDVVAIVYEYAIVPGQTGGWEDIESVYRWLFRFRCAAAVTVAAGIVALGAGLPRVRALAAPLVALAALTHPTASINDLVSDVLALEYPYSAAELWGASIVGAALAIGFAAAAAASLDAIARARARPAAQPIFFAAEGFFRIGSALVAQVAIAVIGLACLLVALGGRSIFFLRLWTFIVPIATLLAAIVLVLGILRAADLRGAAAPRRRLYAAAGLIAWALVVSGVKTLALYQLSKDRDVGPLEEMAEVLAVGVPLAVLVGLLCVVSAVGAVAAHLRRSVTPDGATQTGVLLVVCTGAGVGLQQWALDGGARDQGTFIVLSMIVLVANVIAQLGVARLCQRLAADLHDSAEASRELPRAEVIDGR